MAASPSATVSADEKIASADPIINMLDEKTLDPHGNGMRILVTGASGYMYVAQRLLHRTTSTSWVGTEVFLSLSVLGI
jgi:hypothetical protein